jgi:hypothetical protein
MPLFEVAIIQEPTKKEIEEGTGEETLILAPTSIMAKDASNAVIAAVTSNGGVNNFNPNKCKVLVRPFA